METLNLSLRQRKLLHIMQEHNKYITGTELAKQLGVSARTIRSEIVEINEHLSPHNAKIASERSKGYIFQANDFELIQDLNQIDIAFFTKDDRIRYLAFRLCLSDIPINTYDLEDEIFVSHTTLENDLQHLKMKYVMSEPYIRITQLKDNLEFEHDERKRRSILNQLFHEDWNYSRKGNAYYGYHFLQVDVLDYIMNEIPLHLHKYNIHMEDANIVSLHLAIAIMYHRVNSGHALPPSSPCPKSDTMALHATNGIFDKLEEHFQCSFSQTERDDIYQRIESSHLLDSQKLNFLTIHNYVDSISIEMTDKYLEKIHHVFGLDFSKDEDFYITLLQYIRYLQTPSRIFNSQGNPDIARENLLAEFEIAVIFQEIAFEYMNRYLTLTELLYLAQCLAGALEFQFRIHPDNKIQSVICCHLNLAAGWAIKRSILGAFENYINITDLLPINAKSAYDFSNIDLVLTTVMRNDITATPATECLKISNFMTPTDYLYLSSFISKHRIQKLCPPTTLSVQTLLDHAYWHEQLLVSDYFSIIELMVQDFIKDKIVTDDYLEDILRRESISTFAFHPGILFLHSLKPATKTQLSVVTLDHRIVRNSHKIRVIVMASFRPEDAPYLLHLVHIFNDSSLNIESIKSLKTKKSIIDFFSQS